ncbi:hypothetical protein Tco_0746021 [Tanacetum coccineum]
MDQRLKNFELLKTLDVSQNRFSKFYTLAGNPVKEILLKLNLPDHRIRKDGGEVKEFQRSFSHSDTERLSRSDEVLKLKNFKKDATLKLFKSTNQERSLDYMFLHRSTLNGIIRMVIVQECCRGQDMAPLPPREQRHQFLRYHGLEYSDQDIADFKERLERIHDRGTHRVQVFDFEGMTELIRDVLYARMRMEHRDGDGVMVFTSQAWSRVFETRGPLSESERIILGKGDLHDYWRDISTNGDFLGRPPSYTLIRDPVLRLCHRMMAHSIAGRSQAPEKVTVTDLFYLRGLDVGSVNIPYLLGRYLRRFAAGRKSGALISGVQFVARLAEHFRLLAEERLQGLTVTAPALFIIDMAELVRLQIRVEFGDTWAWVPAGPARLEGDTRGVAKEAPVALGGGDEDEEMPQADQREVLDSMARDFSRFTTWTITSLSRMMDRADVTYTRYSESPVEYQRLSVRRKTFDLFMHDRTKTGSKFSTIVHEYVMEPSMLSKSRAELRRGSVYKSVEAKGKSLT